MNAIKQFNFTSEQISNLLTMQNELNFYINSDWINQGFSWEDAIIDECMEIKGHLGWKWWKDGTYKQGVTEQNKAQIKLEVIDLLHFVMSSQIEGFADGSNEIGELCIMVTKENVNEIMQVKAGVHEITSKLLRSAATYRTSWYLNNWTLLAHSVDMTEQEIMETYVQKFVLNKFRQDHGYNDGSYQKVWRFNNTEKLPGTFGMQFIDLEDNQVLERMVADYKLLGYDVTDKDVLYQGLQFEYDIKL